MTLTAGTRIGLALMVFVVVGAIGGGCSREPTTPEARRQRGDEVVRRMSEHLASAQTLTVETTDTRSRMRGGKAVTVRTTRQFTVRRPDRFAVQVTGDTDLRGWYDGSTLTLVSDQENVWARVNAAATIDDTLDLMAERLAMPLPMADFFYSSSYDALIGPESTGGYVGREAIDGVECVHVAYQHPAADWELWVTAQGDSLPLKFRMTDKMSGRPGTTEVVFHRWTFDVAVPDTAFAPEVPAGYERIQVVVGTDAPALSAVAPATAPSAPKP